MENFVLSQNLSKLLYTITSLSSINSNFKDFCCYSVALSPRENSANVAVSQLEYFIRYIYLSSDRLTINFYPKISEIILVFQIIQSIFLHLSENFQQPWWKPRCFIAWPIPILMNDKETISSTLSSFLRGSNFSFPIDSEVFIKINSKHSAPSLIIECYSYRGEAKCQHVMQGSGSSFRNSLHHEIPVVYDTTVESYNSLQPISVRRRDLVGAEIRAVAQVRQLERLITQTADCVNSIFSLWMQLH
jgi:hypothetical protein